MNKEKELSLEEMSNFCKHYGYIYPGSEIYGGLANTWDYGILGARLKNNIKNAWRKRFIQEQMHAYEIDANILMNPKVWVASGHVEAFYDPKMDCKDCKSRIRADKFIDKLSNGTVNGEGLSYEEMEKYIAENNGKCPVCGGKNFTKIRKFSQMFETYRGSTEEKQDGIYLRPENAQGEYVNYLNVLRSAREKLPFAIGQVGKAFRNEITPGDLTFRTIEFEQMEFQTFCNPKDDMEIYEKYKKYALEYLKDLGLPEEKLQFKDHAKLSHYAKAACDIEYLFPFGYGEINGTHNRTNYDLSRHQEYSKKNMEYQDIETGEKFIPYIIESTVGADRTTLAVLYEAYNIEPLENGEERIVMKFKPSIAPYKLAVLPLIKSKHKEKALELVHEFSKFFTVDYDETASIGKRYRRQDIQGTPFSLTVDDNTLENCTVTIRDRDTMKQITLKIEEVKTYILDKIEF